MSRFCEDILYHISRGFSGIFIQRGQHLEFDKSQIDQVVKQLRKVSDFHRLPKFCFACETEREKEENFGRGRQLIADHWRKKEHLGVAR